MWGPLALLNAVSVYNEFIEQWLPQYIVSWFDVIPEDIVHFLLYGALFLSIVAAYHEVRMRLPRHNIPDTKIKDVVDYVVNDSTAVIPKAPGPEVRHGLLADVIGWEHEEARIILTEAASQGRLTLFGCKKIREHAYSDVRTQIPVEYWQNAELSWGIYIDATRYDQTRSCKNANGDYTNVYACKAEIERLWPRLSRWRRFVRLIAGYRRKTYPAKRHEAA